MLTSLSKDFKKVTLLMQWGQKRQTAPLFYDEQGLKKLLFAVDDLSVLKDYYKENLEPLEIYDTENNTEYMKFLRIYLDNDGSVKKVAEATFVHRNTINYQLNKIKSILNNDMKTFKSKAKIILAFHIKDVL